MSPIICLMCVCLMFFSNRALPPSRKATKGNSNNHVLSWTPLTNNRRAFFLLHFGIFVSQPMTLWGGGVIVSNGIN